MGLIKRSQIAGMNIHYMNYSLDYFLDAQERAGFESIELWGGIPHFYMDPSSYGDCKALKKKIKDHHLKLVEFTPETIAAAKLGKEMGAAVILLTWLEESEIIEFGDYVILYSFDASPDHLAGDIDYAGEKVLCALSIAVELLDQTAGYEHYDKFQDGLDRIPTIIRKARKMVAARAERFAQEYKDDELIYTMGSGASWGSAYMESICIFMEMQWLNSACIHTGEYFHGPFEVTDANRPFMIQISEGSTRALDERCLSFLKKYAKRIEVVDAKELGLSTIDASVIDYFNHSLFNNVYPIYNHALAEARKHPLSTRRYMWRVEY